MHRNMLQHLSFDAGKFFSIETHNSEEANMHCSWQLPGKQAAQARKTQYTRKWPESFNKASSEFITYNSEPNNVIDNI